MKIGLVVNPLAGIGGTVGLKGSDGAEIQARALALGAVPRAEERAAAALAPLKAIAGELELLAAPGAMGERAAVSAGFAPTVLGEPKAGPTCAEDTVQAAQAMQQAGAGLILFAGGDGTARDIARAVGMDLPALGIPAGVKIHSAAFAINPRSAGEAALAFAQGQASTREAEVVDLDEEAYRAGQIATRLYGFLRAPYQPARMQARKSPTPLSEQAQAAALAAAVTGMMEADWIYILGPGTTTRAIAEEMGFAKTLVGVDVAESSGPLLLDAPEQAILDLLAGRSPARAKIIVAPTGGQGFLFGRGNQQISPRVIRSVGREHIVVVCPPHKLAALQGRPFLVDTGDGEMDRMLAGYYRVITGRHERAVYRAAG